MSLLSFDWLGLGLAGLFLASFLAATLLPGGSEAVFLGLLALHPELRWPALLLATLGNTLGGMTSYFLARCLPDSALNKLNPRYLDWARHWGAPVLVLAWAPLIGDLLCVAAGWLRLPWVSSLLWMALGKGLRYLALIGGLAGWRALFG